MSRAYIEKLFIVSKSQYDLVKSHAVGWDEHTYHFFCHLIKSTFSQVRQYRVWIPISSTLIKNHLWKADINAIKQQGLIQVKRYDRKRSLAKEYRLSQSFLLEYLAASPLQGLDEYSVKAYQGERKVNLFTGKITDAFQKSIFYDKSRHPEPKLIVNAIKAIKYSLYNQSAVLRHLQELQFEYKQLENIDEAMFEHKLFDFVLDLNCFESILNQGPVQSESPYLYSFVPAYKVQSTGRIQAIGGGLQSCSKRMKLAAYSGIEDLKIFDIAASHANIILSQMENANIKCKWLENYLSSSEEKYEYSKQIGIKYSTWKRCLYALLMGAPLSDNPVSSIRDYLAMDVAYDEIEEAFQKFSAIVAPLREPVNEWYKYLLEDYVPRHIRHVVGKAYIRNPAGKVKEIKDTLNKGQIAAFLIQGYETAFIHYLTILSQDYHYMPINNEHDALYVIGHISQQAIAEAKAITGLRHLQVSEKVIEF